MFGDGKADVIIMPPNVPFEALDDNLLDIHGELRRRSCAKCGEM